MCHTRERCSGGHGGGQERQRKTTKKMATGYTGIAQQRRDRMWQMGTRQRLLPKDCVGGYVQVINHREEEEKFTRYDGIECRTGDYEKDT